MAPVMLWFLMALAGFALGSIPTGLFVGRWHGIDIRKHGSGNIGATNVGRVLGPRAWALCFTFDVLKGLIPTALAGWLGGELGRLGPPTAGTLCWLGVMAAPVLGHMFTPWLKFRGGKGVATGLGTLLGFFPVLSLPGLGALLVFVLVKKIWGYVSAASLAAALSLPLLVAAEFAIAQAMGRARLADGLWFIAATALLAGLLALRHRANIARLLAGTELRPGSKT